MRFFGKTIIAPGADSGFGRVTAIRFAVEEVQVIAADTDRDTVNTTERQWGNCHRGGR